MRIKRWPIGAMLILVVFLSITMVLSSCNTQPTNTRDNINLATAPEVGETQPRNIQSNINISTTTYENIVGDIFTFTPIWQGGEKYGYMNWVSASGLNPFSDLSHEIYHGKKGKLTNEFMDYNNNFRKAVLEDNEIVYHRCYSSYATTLDYEGVVFDKDLAAARSLIGKTVYAKVKELYTPNESICYPLYNYEPVVVVDVVVGLYGYVRGVGPFFLKVKNHKGEEGMLRYYPNRNFLLVDPLKDISDERIIDAIHKDGIVIGMNQNEVKLSLGDPEIINSTVNAYGSYEQWVYVHGLYLYFDNGTLTSFQSSR
jgi:hypothetical protein